MPHEAIKTGRAHPPVGGDDAEAASQTQDREERERRAHNLQDEADRFDKLLPGYEANPDLFKQRFLMEKLGPILTNAQYKVFLPDRADGKPWELRLQLSKEPEIRKKESPKTE